jgi:pSer/pThr/pTyr-binding forkhead associated (FHA) protein
MQLWLKQLWLDAGSGEIFVRQFPFVIGRHSEADHSLPMSFISRRHCQFIQSEDQVLIQDLESHNGTFVNGRRITLPTPLRDGDEVSLGALSFRVILQAEPPETARACGLETLRNHGGKTRGALHPPSGG